MLVSVHCSVLCCVAVSCVALAHCYTLLCVMLIVVCCCVLYSLLSSLFVLITSCTSGVLLTVKAAVVLFAPGLTSFRVDCEFKTKSLSCGHSFLSCVVPRRSPLAVCHNTATACLWARWEVSLTPSTQSLMACLQKSCLGQELELSM